MEFRTLRYLASLADRGSVTAAARDHYVTQPAVSIQLRKLQEEIGTVLYEVHGKALKFTPAGEVVLEYARRLLELESEMIREITDLGELRRGSVSIGTIDAASIYVLPDVFSMFRERYPGIELHIEIDATTSLLVGLASGDYDFIIGTLPIDGGEKLEIFPVFEEELALIAPAAHPLAGDGEIEIDALREYQFISFHEGSITRRIIERAFAERGLEPQIAMDIDSPEAIKHLVASGLGLAVLPARTVMPEAERGSIVLLRVRDLRITRRLGLIVPAGRYLSAAARAFIRVLEEVLQLTLPTTLNRSGKEG